MSNLSKLLLLICGVFIVIVIVQAVYPNRQVKRPKCESSNPNCTFHSPAF